MISAIAAAGVGLGAFAVFAIPTFMKITGGISAVSAAMSKLSTDKLGKGITAAQLAADRLAQSKAGAAIPGALQPPLGAGLDLKATFDKMVAAMQPQVVRVFGDALKVVRDLLPQLMPIAKTAGNAIDGLLKGFDKFVKTPGFRQFMSSMQQLAGPAITAIGQGLGKVAIALGQFLVQAASPQGLTILRYAFKVLEWAIKGATLAVRVFQYAFTAVQNAIIAVMGKVLGAAKAITDAFLTVVSTVARVASKIPGPWDSAMRTLADTADRAKMRADSFFAGTAAGLDALKHRIDNAQLVFHLKGNIIDLQNKLATANAALKNPDLTATRKARIEANISQAMSQIAAIRVALNALNGTTATTYVQTIPVGGGKYLTNEAGGITGAASGGIGGGGRMGGEHGRELIQTAPGSYVHSHPHTQRTMHHPAGGT